MTTEAQSLPQSDFPQEGTTSPIQRVTREFPLPSAKRMAEVIGDGDFAIQVMARLYLHFIQARNPERFDRIQYSLRGTFTNREFRERRDSESI
jgi:hypothetical protein